MPQTIVERKVDRLGDGQLRLYRAAMDGKNIVYGSTMGVCLKLADSESIFGKGKEPPGYVDIIIPVV